MEKVHFEENNPTDNTDNTAKNGKKRALYEKQVELLKTFFDHGAITKAQYDKSCYDLSEKMGFAEGPGERGNV